MKKIACLIMLLVCLCALPGRAQIVSTDSVWFDPDSVRKAFDDQPYFGLYKDNYFIIGPPIGYKPTRENTNIKFQISIAQRLTRSTLPWGTYLYLFYTQKCFWNVLEKSMPMTDLNFNPGIGIAKPLFVRNRYIGKLSVVLEHESNGRDGDESRSWNRLAFGASIMIDPNIMAYAKFWIPVIDSGNNRDLLKYVGIYQTGMQLMSNDGKFNGSVTLVKRKAWTPSFNVILEFGWRIWKNSNQYFFVQYYNGYGEGLLAYKEHHSNLRIGLQIKPKMFSDF